MKQALRTPLSLVAFLATVVTMASISSGKTVLLFSNNLQIPADTNDPDSALPYPFDDESGGLYMDNPSNYTEEVEYDEESGQYIITQRVGGIATKAPMLMTPEEYSEYIAKKQASDYWQAKTQSEKAAQAEGREPGTGLIPQIQVNSEFFNRMFGSNTIDIRPQGYAELRFGGRFQKVDNPLIPERNRSTFTFDFDQRIQMNVTGKIGEKLQIRTNYDTEATFSFENQMKVEYTGDEDDIIKKIELGNVSLPLNSSLISGAQSLFGVKTQAQFGKLTLTGVFSEQRSQTSSINVQGGATTTEFEIWGDQYEANRHYFLSHYFRDNYERFLANLPLITSPVQITKVEVWVTNTRQATEDTRNILAFMDLGEASDDAYRSPDANLTGPSIFGRFFPFQGFPDNENNALGPVSLENDYPGVRDIGSASRDLSAAGFEEAIEFTTLTNARKLRPSEFNYHPQLGYISLNSALNQDEVLAVAFQFTAGGKTFQVGEFSTDGVTPPKSLVTKMLKSTILNVKAPMWDLMMKNIYSLNAFQVNREDFRLEVLYQNDETGTPIPFLPVPETSDLSDELLLRIMALDQLNNNNDPQPDGFFDYVPGITISPQNGRIIFPVLEPFGSNLARQLDDEELREQYVFSELYDSTRFVAQNQAELNKYLLRGEFKSSSSSEISLNAFNIPQGSVVVTAGGQRLTENVDYTVDYNLGRVKIINEGILNSGTPIKVDFENNALFNFQTRTFVGLNADYRFNENLNLGATVVRLSERPLTQKVNIGDEPIANTIVGMNGNFSKEAPYLTRFVDKIPFIDTKAPSNLTVQGEVAKFIPGSPRGIKIDEEETTYLDDFESSQTSIDIRNPAAWKLASVPAGQPEFFPEASENGIASGFNRAKLAWYTIDPLFHNDQANTPENIRDNKDLQSDPLSRRVYVKEVFPNLEQDQSQAPNLPMLDLAYFPEERGPYNYDVEGSAYSMGLDESGKLVAPSTRWAGIMRDLTTTNFEEQNIEFIQFWVMDPYYSYNNNEDAAEGTPPVDGGSLYINLGSVSEDILRDNKLAVENGIPADGNINQLDTTSWGYVPGVRPVVNTFDNDPAARNRQDVGYDLLDDQQEQAWNPGLPGGSYLNRIENTHGTASGAFQRASNDPAADNFQYYRGSALDNAGADIIERYKNFNNPDGNSDPTQIDGISAFATNSPDVEDVNRDQTLSVTEAYYQYRVDMSEAGFKAGIGNNYITDERIATTQTLPNGDSYRVRWVQFKIPVFSPERKVGPISDFRSIRFIRMFMRDFSGRNVIRFAKMELIRGEWRRYTQDLNGFGDELNYDGNDQTIFEVNAVNIEQNGSRSPVSYVVPPGIQRQVLFGTTSAQQQNEQSLSLRVCGLEDGEARAVFRNINFDMRLYKRLKMFSHAEDGDPFDGDDLADGDLNLFIRMGSDYNRNFYEYEIPLKATDLTGAPITDPEAIWPAENRIDFALDLLREVKLERDRVYNGSGQSITRKYSVQRDAATVTVLGAPNLSNVRTIMIGVRNPRRRSVADADDGLSKCAEVWVNELRLTEFDQAGGWAANARVAAQLADFGNVSVSGRMSTVGFGSIDQNTQERQQENAYAYDLQTNFELGKFFPQKAALRIPMFYGTSEEWRNPQFNPLDPDIEFDEALANLETEEERQRLREASQDYVQRSSLNFTNVRKERTKSGNPMPYDISNFSVSYSFNEIFRRNINILEERQITHRGNINYNYRTQPKAVEPFKNVEWLRNDAFELIRDFNFFWYPRQFNVIASMDRSINKLQKRNTAYPDDPRFDLPATFNNNWNFNRQYSLLWDFTKSLKLDYTANMRTRIDELVAIRTRDTTYEPTEAEKKEEIISNLKDFGRPIQYHQTVNLTWQVPINKLPYLDFVNTQARYTGDYDWQANSLRATNAGLSGGNEEDLNFGNTIQNNQSLQLNNTLNLMALYNQVPYLKKVNSRNGGRESNPRTRRPRVPGAQSRENNEEEEEEEEESVFDKILASTARFATMVRSINANYTSTEGTLLPGFLPTPGFFGMSQAEGNAPGIPFTLGIQEDIRQEAADKGWITTSTLQNNQYTETNTEIMNFRATLEPVDNLRIILTAQRNSSENMSEFFRWNEDEGFFESQNTFFTENFSMSYLTIGTAFEQLKAPRYESDAYEDFKQYRLEYSQLNAEAFENSPENDFGYTAEIASLNPDSSNYGYRGFSANSQQSLIPAFVAAYSGQTPSEFGLDFLKTVPLPNWQINYDGLKNFKFMRKFVSSAVLNHAYRSTYSISNMQTNLLRQQALDDGQAPFDNNGDFLPERQISAVVISEQFAPLLGINMKLKNQTTVRLEYKRDRNVALSMANAQVTETRGSEWVIGAGYIIKDVRLKFIKLGPRRTTPQSNLELKADLGIRDNITIIRRVVEQNDQVTAGQKVVTCKLSGDYQISQRVSAKLFYDLNLSRFKTSSAYPITTHQFGISIRLNLGQ